ncbi:hypothetical protein [Oleidesulfovibrio alaskensis]
MKNKVVNYCGGQFCEVFRGRLHLRFACLRLVAGRQMLKTGRGAEAGRYLIDGVTACICGSIAEWRILAEYVAV